MRKDKLDCRHEVFGKQEHPSRKITKHGDVSGKYAVMLNDGRTTIFVKDASKIAQAKERYEKHVNSVWS